MDMHFVPLCRLPHPAEMPQHNHRSTATAPPLQLDGATVRGALQSVIPAGYERKGIWMGFGFSDPANGYAGMFQSDVVVAGFVGTDCFAVDYYLQNYPFSDPTCDTKRVPVRLNTMRVHNIVRKQMHFLHNVAFSELLLQNLQQASLHRGWLQGQAIGVCPDAMFANSAKANNVNMTACSIRNGVVTVEWERPVKASDQWDRQWATGAPAYAVHATGPLSSATAAKPSLERHFLATPVSCCRNCLLLVRSHGAILSIVLEQLPSLTAHSLLLVPHMQTGFDYKLSLGVKSTCPAVLQK